MQKNTGFQDKSERDLERESWTEDPPAAPRKSQLNLRHADELVRDRPTLRPAIIDGLLRTGETMNFISAPKIGKSWLATSLALSVVSGQKWLGRFWTRKGRVLICDNELHDATMANRIPGIAAAMGLVTDDWGQNKLDIVNLRGELVDLLALCADLGEFTEFGSYDLIILDAFYRFVPRGYDENLNTDMAFLYNVLDACAKKIGCAFVCVHHSTKGSQASKSVVDTGAGAGSMARAADSHFVLRHHEEKDCVVVDAAVRSFAPMQPFVLRWQYPTWTVADGLDPALLRRERPTRRAPTATEDAESPADKKQRLFDEHLQTVMDAFSANPGGETSTAIKDICGMNSRTYGPIHSKLLRDKVIRPCRVEKNGRFYPGAILVGDTHFDPNPDNPDKTVFSVSVSGCESDTITHTRTTALSLESGVCPDGVIADDVLSGATKKRLSGLKAVRVKTKAKTKKALTSSEKIKDLRAMVTKAASLLDRMTDTMTNTQKPDSPPTDITAKPGSGALFDSFYNGY